MLGDKSSLTGQIVDAALSTEACHHVLICGKEFALPPLICRLFAGIQDLSCRRVKALTPPPFPQILALWRIEEQDWREVWLPPSSPHSPHLPLAPYFQSQVFLRFEAGIFVRRDSVKSTIPSYISGDIFGLPKRNGTRLVPQSETIFTKQKSRRPRRNLFGVLCTVLKRRSRPEISAKNVRRNW